MCVCVHIYILFSPTTHHLDSTQLHPKSDTVAEAAADVHDPTPEQVVDEYAEGWPSQWTLVSVEFMHFRSEISAMYAFSLSNK